MSAEELCLGRIKSIEKFQLNISLAHGASGRVKISDISSPYRAALERLVEGDTLENVKMLSDMFHIGQVVRCSVKAGAKPQDSDDVIQENIELSIDPVVVNRNIKKGQIKSHMSIVGAIESIEDKGYILDAGIRQLRIFLPFDKTPLPTGEKYSVGSLVEFMLPSSDGMGKDARVMRATMSAASQVFRQICELLSLGMIIPVVVRLSVPEGVKGVFQSYNITIPSQQCLLKPEEYPKSSRVITCITSIDLVTKELKASLLPHLLPDNTDPSVGLDAHAFAKIGSRCEDALIDRCERNIVYLRLPSLHNVRAILLRSNAFDGAAPKDWTKKFDQTATTNCRVIDFDFFQNVAVISIKKNIIESQVLSLDDVKLGSSVSAIVKKCTKRGVSVRIAGKVRGIIPFIHLSDASISDPQDRFPVGSKILAKVLSIESDKEQLLLTAKKSLMNPDHMLLGSANMSSAWETRTVTSGPLLVTAYAVHVSERGVLVSGMNNTRGWIPRRETFADNSQPMKQFFSPGQTLQLRVIKRLSQTQQRPSKQSSEFLLSQILEREVPASRTSDPLSSVSVGDVFACVIVKHAANGLQVELRRQGDIKPVSEAMLPSSHFSDSVTIALLAWQSRGALFKPKTTLCIGGNDETVVPTQVVVISVARNEVVVSAKQSLVAAAQGRVKLTVGGFVSRYDQLTVGSQWLGWIVHHKEYGAFVQFPGGLRGLAPTRLLADKRAPEGIDWAQVVYPAGATVEAKVVEVGLPETRRFLVSLRMLDTYTSAQDQYVGGAVARLQAYLEETRWICSHVKRFKPFAVFSPGSRIDFTVEGLTEEFVTGTAVASAGGAGLVPALALLPNTAGVDCALGCTYSGVVTSVNLDACRLEVSLSPWLVKNITQRLQGGFSSKPMQVQLRQSIASSAVSLGNRRDVVVVCLKEHGVGHLALLPARRSFNDVFGGNAWELEQVNRVTIRRDLPARENSASDTLFLATLTVFDPIANTSGVVAKRSGANVDQATVDLQELVPGARIPGLVFIGLKGRLACFRLPNTRGLRNPNARVFCRLVDLVHTAKEARSFMKSPPDLGTEFEDAVVLDSAPPVSLKRSRGARLPLSSCLTEVSFVVRNGLSVGDLVCGQVAGVADGGIHWRILLPSGARGILHVTTCMEGQRRSPTGRGASLPHLKKGVWVTCRLIDQLRDPHVADATVIGDVSSEEDDEEAEVDKEAAALVAVGEEIVPVCGGKASPPPRRPTPQVFYVSTVVADIRKWDPTKYRPLELEENKTYSGYIKKRAKNSLIVSLSYNVDVIIPFSSPTLRKNIGIGNSRFCIGAATEVVVTSVKNLTARLADLPRLNSVDPTCPPPSITASPAHGSRRQRTVSLSQTEEASSSQAGERAAVKRQRRSSTGEAEETNILLRFARFLPPPPQQGQESASQQQHLGTDVDMDYLDDVSGVPIEDQFKGGLEKSLANEMRVAAIAAATVSATHVPLGLRPTSVNEFEVAVRNAPTNVHLWTLYTAHHLSAGHIDKARAVVERALSMASRITSVGGANDPRPSSALESATFTSSLLLAALNLEIAAVTGRGVGGVGENVEDEKKKIARLEEVLGRIDQLDRETTTRRAVEALSNAGLHNEAENLAKRLVRRHALNPDAWLCLVRSRFRGRNIIGAREAQRNAGRLLRLVHLPYFATGSARLESEFGDFDRAMSLFDEQLTAHPQRRTLYVDYINLLLAAGRNSEAQSVRIKAVEKLSEGDREAVNRLFL